jgi:hypothetical protein
MRVFRSWLGVTLAVALLVGPRLSGMAADRTGRGDLKINREEGNTAAERIANREPNCQGIPIAAVVAQDSRTFSIQVGWSGKSRRFPSRPEAGTSGSGDHAR